jgi:predicted metal-dependent phosphoesterase TrpH
MKLIDLHAHTTASDGALEPEGLVDLARETGLAAVAVTDHDTVDGAPRALAAGKESGTEVVPGVEISAEFNPGTMHMLGYFIDPEHPALTGPLFELQDARQRRNPRIVESLNNMGFGLTMDEVEQAAGGGQVGRPHFARVMVDKGYAADVQEVFDKYLAKGGPAYVEKFRLTPEECISMIRRAGGLPVLAHPFTLRLEDGELADLVDRLKSEGLEGLEVLYSEHTPEMADKYLNLARRLELLPTGGSDYHGPSKPDVSLGRGMGDLAVPYQFLDDMKKRLEGGG